ncbi:NusG domain II-containing protein [Kosmotoga pacifica]|nr:NusG domain II-containing protein [Kosmotoga pacifica]
MILFALLVGIILVMFTRVSYIATEADIYVDGKAYMKIDISKDATYNVADHMVVEVFNGKIRVKESDCPEKLCVKQGWVSSPEIPIVCLPNKIIIKIVGTTSDEEMDAITR